MNRKVCLITGANAGIGKAAAILFASKGFHVIVGSRDKAKGEQAVENIIKLSNNPLVDLALLDMSSFTNIRACANHIEKKYEKIDVLIHNAADFDISRKQIILTEDKIEQVWATNHLGPVLLTNLLLNLVKKSSQGKILTIASQGLMLHPNLEINFEDPEFKKSKFSVTKAYYQSKLAQVMYTYWLAEKLKDTNICVNCIRVTNVKIDISRYPNLPKFMKFMYAIKSLFSISPEEMAATYYYVSTSKELDELTGKYFNEKNQLVNSSKYSCNKHNIEKLMELTSKYLNL